jgi:predicted O-linked N-acetylglucosamine transferase (SPINDLY family)
VSVAPVNVETVETLLSAFKFDQAAAALDTLEQAHPESIELMNLRGYLHLQKGEWAAAIRAVQRACDADPRSERLVMNLGRTQKHAGDPEGALASYERAAQLAPKWDEPYLAIAEIHIDQGRFHKALAWSKTLLERFPNSPGALWTYAMTLHLMGRTDEGMDVARRAMLHSPTAAYQVGSYAHFTNSVPNVTPQWVFEQHQHFGKLMTRHFSWRGAAARTLPQDGRRLRVGFISPDLRAHSVSFFIEPVFRHRDRAAFELFVYFTKPPGDHVTERLRPLADHWTEFRKVHPDYVAQRIRADNLDLLIDLAGHTQDNSLVALQQRPAAVQATYLGYPNTTGMTAIQYRIVDSHTDPPGAEQLASEKLLRLDPCFICFQPPPDQPPPLPPPCNTAGHVTFGSFNMLKKVNDPLIGVWARVLNAVPGSRMLLKSKGLDEPEMADEIAARFASHGVERHRVECLGMIKDMNEHRNIYGRLDIALDTFPYNGTTTTCEALWMGVPVVTLAGNMHAGRVGVSLLSCVGLPDLIARDEDDFVRIASALAADRPRLTALRADLRERMAASPLCDGPGFCRRFEAAMRTMIEASQPAKA